MNTSTAGRLELTQFEQLSSARDVILCESRALEQLANNLPIAFSEAVQLICETTGAVIVTGMGKAGWIGQKVSASFASTGTRSHFVHPAEAFHGDLGRVGPHDTVLAFSNSGETSEIVQILPSLKRFDNKVIAITAGTNSTLAKHAELVLEYGKTPEAGHLGLAPSTSTTVMLAMGDALALVVSRNKSFRDVDFAKFHPGGSLGRQLSLVDEVMRPLARCRISMESETIRNIYVRHASDDRRVGVILVIDNDGVLTGLFTDSDLARMLERQQDRLFDCPISEVMTKDPVTTTSGTRTAIAVETLACRNLSELPVVDKTGRPIGLIDITDVVNI